MPCKMDEFQFVDVSFDNLEECLTEDKIFVQFFNSFLGLPVFPKQLIYNGNTGHFEEFHSALADDVNGEGDVKEVTTLKQRFEYFKTTSSTNEKLSKVGYYVKVLEKRAGLTWVKENRLSLFLRSELYADYKLSKYLASSQVSFLKGLLNEQLNNGNINNETSTHIKTKLSIKCSEVRPSITITCEDSHIFEILWQADSENAKDNNDESGKSTLLENNENYAVNLLFKQGVDAFKEFVCETVGEKHLLLWTVLERSKHFLQTELTDLLVHIKERFLKLGSTYGFSKETIKSWSIDDMSNLTIQDLYEKRKDILDPLLKYWCHRFTTHQYKEKLKFVKQDQKSSVPVNLEKEDHVPVRPFSCRGHIRAYSEMKSFEELDTLDTGITRQKMRTKSAYPRLVSSQLPKSTNAGHKQLQLMFFNREKEGFGFKPRSAKYYHNDACSLDEKKSVRLYLQPVPPFNIDSSAIQEVTTSSPAKDEDIGEMMELEKDMDSLVDMLLHEDHTGNFFYCFLKSQNNQIWLNCYEFWKNVQQFTEYFFADSFHPSLVNRKANLIYSTFIGNQSPRNMQCPSEVKVKIQKKLDPPFEDLFDEAEFSALSVLIQPWLSLIMKENQQYATLKMEEHLRYMEISRTQRLEHYIDNERFDGEAAEAEEEPEDGKISPEEVSKPLSISKDGLSFEVILRNKVELEHFQNFLETRHKQGILDLTAWTDMEVFRRMVRGSDAKIQEERDKKAMEIREKWLAKNYFFGTNSPATKSGIRKVLESGDCTLKTLPKRPPSPVISEAQKYARARVERRWLVMFKETKEYLQRRRRASGVTEMVEDILMKKKIQRSEHAWRLLNSRWNSSSREVSGLRMALSNEEECHHFRQFIKFRGDMMENNLNFWLEVQKYKDLCHNHVEEDIIYNKIQTIIDVFIKSSVPPELQIDVPIEIADRLVEKAFGKTPQLGPYLFREAQTTVFRIMFNLWKDFFTFRSQATEQGNLKHSLDELERQQKQEVIRKKLIAERRRLSRLVSDKRKIASSVKERKLQDILSVMAKSITATEDESLSAVVEYDVTSFSYSKHKAEDELKLIDAKLRQQGVDELSNTTLWSNLRRKISMVIPERQSRDGPPLDLLHAPRRMSFFNTNGAMEIRRMSLGVAFTREEEKRANRDMGKGLNDNDSKTIKPRHDHPGGWFRYNPSRDGKSAYGDAISRAGRSSNDRMSSITELHLSGRPPKPVKQKSFTNTKKNGGKLTRKSLKEFEKTPQGKPLKPMKMVTLPFVNNLENENYETIPLPALPKPKRKSKALLSPFSKRLPRNSGTAAIYEKQLKEAVRPDSPPQVIEAEVVVC